MSAFDRYCVFGNPIAHSKSPAIHARFAAQTGQHLTYEALLAPLGGFATAVRDFIAHGGKGANVTVPFKEEAFRLCDRLTPRAERAGAVNTLVFGDAGIVGDNTDGAGLVQDLTVGLGFLLAGRRVLLLGAGGAARGALAPLLEAGAGSVVIANITIDKALELAASANDLGNVRGCGFSDLAGRQFDVVINATSASLTGDTLPLPPEIFAPGSLAYEMMYGKGETPFMAQARAGGSAIVADGLGMLVEQAAEAFAVWRGVRPDTAPVLAELRAALAAS
ncbi:MAG: shikimate dehydrogenase [Betaproteobacteria bacterium]